MIKENQETITLRGVKTNKSYECQVITSDRVDYEKYLGNDWFKFLFHVQEPQTVMLVELIRINDLPYVYSVVLDSCIIYLVDHIFLSFCIVAHF